VAKRSVNVSIIIPTYNRAEYIGKAIESVLAQTYKDYEIIIVDDGSIDNTKQVLEPYMNRIRYICQGNGGVSAARNTGIKAAKGKWIAFLDSDDRWLPHKLACQMEFIRDTTAKVCFTNVTHVHEPEPLMQVNCNKGGATHVKLFSEPFDLILDKSCRLYVQTMLIEHNLLERAECFDESLTVAEDTRLIFRLAFKTPFAYISEPHVIINRSNERKGLTNDTWKASRARCEAGIVILSEAYFKCYQKDKSIIRKLRQRLAYFLSRKAELDCMEGNNNDARRLAWDSVYFGTDIRTYVRALGILCCPWLVRMVRKDGRYQYD